MHKGFTLIELLLVVVIIGIVAAFVLPKFGDVKEKAYVSAMKNDLRNLATDQEIYFEDNGAYRTDGAPGIAGAVTSDDVALDYADSPAPSNDGYVAIASHSGTSINCALNRTNASVTDPSSGDIGGITATVGVGQLVCK